MKSSSKQKAKINANTTLSYVLHAVSIVVIMFLAYKVAALEYRTNTLTNAATELNAQSLKFNARTNNLKGCWQNNDLACPEGKYFDFDMGQFKPDNN